jgi:hypothetical protein
MMLPARLATSSLLLLLAACGGPESQEAGTENLGVQSQAVVTTRSCTVGDVTVTVSSEGASYYEADEFDPCELLDGNFEDFAIIGYNGAGEVSVQFSFATKKQLTGFRAQTGGYDDNPSEYQVTMGATCDQGYYLSHPNLYSGKQSALSFDSPCTTSNVTFTFARVASGAEHLTELSPVYLTASSPLDGDRMTQYTAPKCGTPERLQGADILSASTGASVGRIQLWRSLCSRLNPNTGLIKQVYYYYARSLSSVGVPPDMDYMSTFLRYTNSAGQSGRLHLTTNTQWQAPSGIGDVSSNIWGAFAGTDVVTVSACGRYYPNNQTPTPSATAAGCTPHIAVQ